MPSPTTKRGIALGLAASLWVAYASPAHSKSDFDCDGFDDLAIGAPSNRINGLSIGSVSVIYGGVGKLTSTANQFFTQDTPGVAGTAEAGDAFGHDLAVGDFNNDGCYDLVIGVPQEGIGDKGNAGAVNVLYGAPSGLSVVGNQIWFQDSVGISGASEVSDWFGDEVATGDFDNDGYDDLAIGVPFEDTSGAPNAGAVNVLYGSPSGLTADRDQVWYQDTPGVAGASETNDYFGAALATGDFDNDGYEDLAVGVSSEDVLGVTDTGAVNILYGSASGLTTAGEQIWYQDIPGIAGGGETGDAFGSSLTAADFDNDGYVDLAIGVPFEDIGDIFAAGAVNILYGGSGGLTTVGNQIWYQDSPDVAGAGEPNDWLGGALTTGDFDNDGFEDLAIGAASEDIGQTFDAGAVNVLYGSSGGLTEIDDQIWYQDLLATGVGATFEYFGAAITTGDFDNDGHDDLAVGVPDDGSSDRGSVNVIYGVPGGAQFWRAGFGGLLGQTSSDSNFGNGL